jgi:DNA-binding NarL/FixJ family response regulator
VALGIAKVRLSASGHAVAPSDPRARLRAVLREIGKLRAGHELDVLLEEELVSLEGAVGRSLEYVNRGVLKPGLSPLSERELDVLNHVAAGLSNKQIATRLDISEKTVRNHLNRIFSKLSVTNRTEAVVTAMRDGLVTA